MQNKYFTSRIPDNIRDFLSNEEVDDILRMTEEIGDHANIWYRGEGFWEAIINDRLGCPLASKRIPEKNGAPGGWHRKDYPLTKWTMT